MKSKEIYPWLRPDDSPCDSEGWSFVRGDGSREPLPKFLKDWTSGDDVHTRRYLKLDMGAILLQSGLSKDSELLLGVTWISKGNNLRGNAFAMTLKDSYEEPIEISIRVPGDRLSEILILKTYLARGRSVTALNSLAATRAGALLWEHRTEIRIEGQGALFPVVKIPFSGRYPQKAGWHLSWNVNHLDEPFDHTLQLLINEEHDAVLRAVEQLDKMDLSSTQIRSAIFHDVARTLILQAVQDEDFVRPGKSYPRKSLGAAILGLIGSYCPGESAATLARLRETDPDQLETILKGAFPLFWGTVV